MLLKRIEKHISLKALQEDFRKLGINFVTAGIIGVFVNHYVGTKLATMFWTAFWVTSAGLSFLTFGLFRCGGNKE